MNNRITNTRIADAPVLPGRMKQDQTVMRHNKVHYHGGNPGRQTPYPCRPCLRLLPGRYQPVQGVTDNKEGLQSQYESSTVMNSSNGTFLSKNPFSDKPIRCNDGFIKAQMDNLTVCSKSWGNRIFPYAYVRTESRGKQPICPLSRYASNARPCGTGTARAATNIACEAREERAGVRAAKPLKNSNFSL